MKKSAAFRKSWLGLLLGLIIALALSGCRDDHGGAAASSAEDVIISFTANPASITQGQGTILAFTANEGEHAGQVTYSIDQGVGSVTGSSATVSPTATTTYTLTASWPGGSATASSTVTVQNFVSKFVYVANGSSNNISAFTLDDATGVLAAVAGSPFAAGASPKHVTSDPQGQFLFVSNATAATLSVYAIDASTGSLTPVAGSPFATSVNPWCSAVSPDGYFVYVRSDSKIDAFSLNRANGVLTPLAGSPFTAAGASADIMVHPSGRYLFTPGSSTGQFHVFRIDSSTGALSPAGGSPYTVGAADLELRGVAVNPTGQFVFVKSEKASASQAYGYRLDINSGALSVLSGSPFPSGSAFPGNDAWHVLTFSPVLSVLYATFYSAPQDLGAYSIDLGSGSLTGVAGSPYAWFGGNGSDQVAISRNGKWAVAIDYSGNRIANGSVDAGTGALTKIGYIAVGSHPSSVVIVGVLQ